MTLSALTFARRAEIGRIHFTRVGSDIQYDLVPPDPASVLAKLAEGGDAGKILDGYNPPQPEFKALKDKLAELRKGTLNTGPKAEAKPDKPRVHVSDGKILRPGMKDARVVALRKRLDIAGDKDSPLYDDAVRDAVKTFQTESELEVDGNLGPNTSAPSMASKRKCVAQATIRSTPSSSTWSAGAGCRATSATPMLSSTSRTTR